MRAAQSLACIRGLDAQRFAAKGRPHTVELIQAVGRDRKHQLELSVAARHEREGRQPGGRAHGLNLGVQAGEGRLHANADAVEAGELIERRDEAVAGVHGRARDAPEGTADGNPDGRRVVVRDVKLTTAL